MVVDGKQLAFLQSRYSALLEAGVLEAVFSKEYWADNNPEAALDGLEFDFKANADRAKAIMKDYSEKVKAYSGDADHAPEPSWEEKFWTLYETGLYSQRSGKHPKIGVG